MENSNRRDGERAENSKLWFLSEHAKMTKLEDVRTMPEIGIILRDLKEDLEMALGDKLHKIMLFGSYSRGTSRNTPILIYLYSLMAL